MIFNQIKYKGQNSNIEITVNILSSMARDTTCWFFSSLILLEDRIIRWLMGFLGCSNNFIVKT